MFCTGVDQPLGAIAETTVNAVDNTHNVVRQSASSDSSVKRLSRKSSGSANGTILTVLL